MEIITISREYLLLCKLANIYANECTKQEEKFGYYKRNKFEYTWEDCIAAYQMLNEEKLYWEYVPAFKKGIFIIKEEK